jgi:CyaY protein
MAMEENTYQALADAALGRIEHAFEDVDANDVDCERSGDVVTLTLKGGRKCVVNTQRPTRQLWLAANARAWHFGWDEQAKRWLDDKGQTNPDGSPVDLFGEVRRIVRETSGVDVDLA